MYYMAQTYNLTSKAQITVPKHIRDMLGLKPGGKAIFRVNKDGEVVLERLKTFEEIHAMLGEPTFKDPLSPKERLVIEGMKKDGHKAFR